jgi:hypothetical protein
LKKYGLFSEKNDMWQDQCEICIYLIGSTDYLCSLCGRKNFAIYAKTNSTTLMIWKYKREISPPHAVTN